MATTEQRTGFRLPWASDARPGVSDEDQTPPAADATRDPDGATNPPTAAEATEMQETTIPDPRLMSWPEADGSSGQAVAEADTAVAEADTAVAEADATVAEADAAADEVIGAEAIIAGEAAPEAAPEAAAVATAAAAARPRRENLLVTGLVRAMRDAAAGAREETAARFADEAKARIEGIHADSAEEATELRKQADAEIVEIRDWSKAEMAHIREQTDERIADRKRRLETDVDGHAARVEHRIEGVQAAVTEFERRMNTFFETLMAEEDPARLAGLAGQLPEPPSLDLDDLDEATPASDTSSFPLDILDSRGAAAAEAEAFAGLDESAEGEDDTTSTDDDALETIADDDVARRLDAFTAHAAPTAEPVRTELAVVGLVSVASIAGFKRAIAKTHGVRAVSVASGPSGDFVFNVTHDPEADLRSTIPALDGFKAVITDDTDGVLTITATDPDSTH